jgi:NAD-reducing hydrogenase small subunit
MSKARLATIWLDGCSGCHMSFLDMDERLVALAQQVDLVYSPYVDVKDFPENVDITLVEGAIGSEEDHKKIRLIRERSRLLVSLGDCAVTGNVSAMRNIFDTDSILQHIYVETPTRQPQVPSVGTPRLLARACPIHEVVKVDIFVPGCPPSADTICFVLEELLAGRQPDLSSYTRFGA